MPQLYFLQRNNHQGKIVSLQLLLHSLNDFAFYPDGCNNVRPLLYEQQQCVKYLCHLQHENDYRVSIVCYTYPKRFESWRSAGFSAQWFNRRTALEPTTKLSYEAL